MPPSVTEMQDVRPVTGCYMRPVTGCYMRRLTPESVEPVSALEQRLILVPEVREEI